jgi:hypothetical protein
MILFVEKMRFYYFFGFNIMRWDHCIKLHDKFYLVISCRTRMNAMEHETVTRMTIQASHDWVIVVKNPNQD